MIGLSLVIAFALAGQTPVGRLHGRVLDPSGAVIAGASVVLVGAEGQVVETKTDRQGAYTLERLAPGDDIVVVTEAGFADAREAITIVAGSDRTLDVTLAIAIQRVEVVIQAEPAGGVTDPTGNASATIIKGKDLDALSDDPGELEAQLHALAGPGAGGVGGQIYIDGFTGGKLPPKGSIQEIRLNQNPYSAEFDTLGAGRIEIVTKPGSQTMHGRFLLDGSTAAWDTRNPFLSQKPDSHYAFAGGMLGGPLGRAASFVIAGDLQERRETGAVNAVVLDASLRPVPFNQTVPSPRALVGFNPRVDVQPAHNHTLSVRYRYTDEHNDGIDVGQLALASQGLDLRTVEHAAQASDLQILSPTLLNDVRFEYRKFESTQSALSAAPQLAVLGAFTGGGNSAGNSGTSRRHLELHDYVSRSMGSQMLRVGGRLRTTFASDASSQSVNGTFTFSSLDAFQITEQGLRQGWTPGQIRAAGGGASQFTIVIGQPAVSDTMADVGLFVQDDWHLRPNLTISGGLRYETQNDIRVRANVAPRLSAAWGLGAPKKGVSPSWVIRSGVGLFYDRVPQALALQAARLDGVRTQQFVIPSPDFFPAVPSATALTALQPLSTVYRIDPALTEPVTAQGGVTVERKFGRTSTLAVGYLYSRGVNQLLSRNVTLPPALPTYQFESEGTFHQHQLTTNFNLSAGSSMSFNGYYVLSSARGNTSGSGSFPSNPLDLGADYGRTAFDVRHRFAMFTQLELPGVRLVPFITASSGQPFDITVGRDLNGDSIFNDRPAFATGSSRPSVVLTKFGAFDTAPIAGQAIVPRNFGTAPAQVSVNLRLTKPFPLGEHDTLRIDLVVSNLLNHVNAAPPVGNLSSPLFGQSTGLSSTFSPSANRQIHLQLQLLF